MSVNGECWNAAATYSLDSRYEEAGWAYAEAMVAYNEALSRALEYTDAHNHLPRFTRLLFRLLSHLLHFLLSPLLGFLSFPF